MWQQDNEEDSGLSAYHSDETNQFEVKIDDDLLIRLATRKNLTIVVDEQIGEQSLAAVQCFCRSTRQPRQSSHLAVYVILVTFLPRTTAER